MRSQASEDEGFAARAWRVVEAKAEARGDARGRAEGLRTAVRHLCTALSIPFDEARRAHVDALDADQPDALCTHLEQHRAWPT